MSLKLSEEVKIVVADHDPNATTSANVSSTTWVDMSEYHRCMVLLIKSVGSDNTQIFRIDGSAALAGTSAATLKTRTGSTDPDATGDWAMLEVTSDDLAGQDSTTSGVRYISAVVKTAAATDEWQVVYILSSPRYGKTALTAGAGAAAT